MRLDHMGEVSLSFMKSCDVLYFFFYNFFNCLTHLFIFFDAPELKVLFEFTVDVYGHLLFWHYRLPQTQKYVNL